MSTTDQALTGPSESRTAEVAAEEEQNLPDVAKSKDLEKEAAVVKVEELHGAHVELAEDTSRTAAEEAAAAAAAEAESDGKGKDKPQDTSGTSPSAEAETPPSPDAPPPAPPANPTAGEAQTFMGQISAYFEAAKARCSNAFTAGLETAVFAITTGASGMWDWVKDTWGKVWGIEDEKKEGTDESQEPGEEIVDYQTDDETFLPNDPEMKKLIASADRQLKEVMTRNPTWIDFARQAGKEYGVCPETILAMARFESGGFNPNAKAETSTAEGLGQFIKKTWASFINSNPDFAEAKPSDPRAALFAIAWYAKKNATDCSIDLGGENATAELYMAHHEGAASYKKMKAFQRGELSEVPALLDEYKDKAFPKFGVEKVTTYEHYVTLVTRMAERVEIVADHYKIQLEQTPEPLV